MTRGQSIVEFALVLPLLMLVLLAFSEAAILVAHREAYRMGVEVSAQWGAVAAAERPDTWRAAWADVDDEERERAGCSGPSELLLPEDTSAAGDRLRVVWTCEYLPTLTNDLGIDWPVVVEGSAVVPVVPVVLSPSPSP